MSDIARKPDAGSEPETEATDVSIPLRIMPLARQEPGEIPLALKSVFEKIFQTVRNFVPKAELFVGHCSSFSHTCKIEFGTELFEPLCGLSIDVGEGPFAVAIAGSDALAITDEVGLALALPAFPSYQSGTGVVIRIEMAGDLVSLICFFQAHENGPVTMEMMKALKNVAELAGMAAASSDLSLDIEAQQLHVDTLRAEVEEVRQFYRKFSETIRQCFWVIDLETKRAIIVSDNFERIWGAKKDILAESITGFMANVLPADRDRVLSEFHTRMGQELDIELRVLGEDGEVRWIWLRAFPSSLDEKSTGPNAKRIVVIADDITEKKHNEEMTRDREAQLVSSARMMAVGDLASGVAHEINNPLTIIVGKAAEIKSLIEKPDIDRVQIAVKAEKIQQTSIRISEIVSSLKALSKQDKGAGTSLVPFAQIIQEIKDLCSERLRVMGVELRIAEFPPHFMAEVNPTMISQVLMNLVNNAVDAVQSEKEKWVRVDWADDEDSAFLYVTDSGPGIPIKIRSRIFDPFFTTKSPGKGTGLGLSLAASIAAHHQGMLRLDNLHPHTRFVLQLPKRQRPKDD